MRRRLYRYPRSEAVIFQPKALRLQETVDGAPLGRPVRMHGIAERDGRCVKPGKPEYILQRPCPGRGGQPENLYGRRVYRSICTGRDAPGYCRRYPVRQGRRRAGSQGAVNPCADRADVFEFPREYFSDVKEKTPSDIFHGRSLSKYGSFSMSIPVAINGAGRKGFKRARS